MAGISRHLPRSGHVVRQVSLPRNPAILGSPRHRDVVIAVNG